jgi:hypothetical protein
MSSAVPLAAELLLALQLRVTLFQVGALMVADASEQEEHVAACALSVLVQQLAQQQAQQQAKQLALQQAQQQAQQQQQAHQHEQYHHQQPAEPQQAAEEAGAQEAPQGNSPSLTPCSTTVNAPHAAAQPAPCETSAAH